MTPDELQQKYLGSLTERIEELTALARSVQQGDQTAEIKLRNIAHSLHGSGSTFGFPQITEAARNAEQAVPAGLLPKVAELIAVLRQVISAGAQGGNVTDILIVDDDMDFAGLLKSSFAGKPEYRLFHAATAVKAQEYLVKNRFALILLDLVLPDRDGRDVLREIKLEFNIEAPVYVLSAIEKDLIRMECMSLGANKFITKPVDIEALVNAIDKMLKKSIKRELTLVPLGSETASSAAKRVDGPKVSVTGKAVLVAEDDAMQATMIRQRLLKEGMVVDHVTNGQEALNSLHDKPYALFILDVNMPKVDGFDVLQKIRKDPITKNIPVIMLTAMGSESDIIRAYDLGADDYILKPFSAIQLVARAKSLLKKAV
ncbi:MAG: response regulator [Pseudomonadota bacterium]